MGYSPAAARPRRIRNRRMLRMHDFPSTPGRRDHCPGRARRARLPRGWGAPFARQAKPDQSPVGRSSGECKISHHPKPPPLELSAGLWLPPGTGEGSTPTAPDPPRSIPQPGSATEHPRSLSRPAGGADLDFRLQPGQNATQGADTTPATTRRTRRGRPEGGREKPRRRQGPCTRNGA